MGDLFWPSFALRLYRLLLQTFHEFLCLLVAHRVVPGAGEIADLRPVIGDGVGIGAVAEIDAVGFDDLRGGEHAGAGRQDRAGGRVFARQRTRRRASHIPASAFPASPAA